jgi:SpoVK/Ycf46/Vps4 family AAA+-type ATPase
MTKREREMDEEYPDKKRRIEILDAPPIDSIADLIKIGQAICFYRNLDTIMLWKIAPYLEELENLVGMETLKESLFYQILYYIQGMHLRNENEEYLHTILMGPPGTGKTTVAQIIAKIYRSMGILSPDGPFKIAHRDDFIAGYLGQSALKTQKLLKSCIGGVLFIDEVYALGPGQEDKDSFSKEAIDTLTSFLSEHTTDFCCIAAGYEKDIQKCFFAVNNGLESRFPWKHIIDPYSSDDLAEIFTRKVIHANWATCVNKPEIARLLSLHKDLFQNAGRDIINFLTKCKMCHAKRVICLQPEAKFILTLKDLENGIEMMKKHTKPAPDNSPPFGMYT